MMAGKKFADLADEIQRALLERGFTVHRYDAYSSSSVYLKLDYGACGSIRVGDHKGYRHLHYMWNIGTWIERQRHENHKVKPRHFYPVADAGAMVDAICALRDRRVAAKDYGRRVEIGRRCMRSARSGFWAHPETREVKLPEVV